MATPHDVAGARRVTPTYGLRVGRDGLKRRGSGDGAEGSTLTLFVDGNYTGALDGNTARLTGTFEVESGTGRFEGATGGGDIEADVTDNGETGTFVASLLGELILPEEPDPPKEVKKDHKKRKNCSKLEDRARKNCQQNKNGNGNGNGTARKTVAPSA
jgi:hypothetical protein